MYRRSCICNTCTVAILAPVARGPFPDEQQPSIGPMARKWEVVNGTLLLFGMFTLQSFMDHGNVQRDLDVVELWAGVQSIVIAARGRGFRAEGFDKNRIPGTTDMPGPKTEDILTHDGFCNAAKLVLRLRPGGLLHLAPVCSSFVGLDTMHTQRSKADFRGDERFWAVEQGNLFAHIAVFLTALAVMREAHASFENPVGSMIWSYVKMYCSVLDAFERQIVPRCRYAAGPGPHFQKKYKFSASGRWIHKVRASCTCPDGKHRDLVERNDAGDFRATKALKSTQAYPSKLGEAILEAWSGSPGPTTQLIRSIAKAVWRNDTTMVPMSSLDAHPTTTTCSSHPSSGADLAKDALVPKRRKGASGTCRQCIWRAFQ